MAPISNLGRVKFGTAISWALAIAPVSTNPENNDIVYPTATPQSIAICEKNPLPKYFMANVVPSVIAAIIIFVLAMLNAVGIKFNPITIIIGPTTCAGKTVFNLSVPIFLIKNDIITYMRPAINIPPWAYVKSP